VDGRRGRRFSTYRPPRRPRRAQRSVGSAVVGRLAVLLDTASRPPRHRILCAIAKRQSHSPTGLWTTTVARLTGPAWPRRLAPGDGPLRARPRRPYPPSSVPFGGAVHRLLARPDVATTSGLPPCRVKLYGRPDREARLNTKERPGQEEGRCRANTPDRQEDPQTGCFCTLPPRELEILQSSFWLSFGLLARPVRPPQGPQSQVIANRRARCFR
jgi:hypothetical protein